MYAVIDNALEQHVAFPDGHSYTHRCHRSSYESIAQAIEEQGSVGFTLATLIEREDLPCSQADVALSFLKERGCVEVRYRRCYAAPGYTFEDAMVEYCWLEHRGQK